MSRTASCTKLNWPRRKDSRPSTIAKGRRETMLIMMIIEPPLPMPRCVICSASHMKNIVADVMQSTVSRRKPQPGAYTTLPMCSRPTARPSDWPAQRTSVR